jgi:hypothetical protein
MALELHTQQVPRNSGHAGTPQVPTVHAAVDWAQRSWPLCKGMLFKVVGQGDAHEFALGWQGPTTPHLFMVHATFVVELHRSQEHLWCALCPCPSGCDSGPVWSVIS